MGIRICPPTSPCIHQGKRSPITGNDRPSEPPTGLHVPTIQSVAVGLDRMRGGGGKDGLVVLLDLTEAELPVGSKGWNTVGVKFREWAAITEYPSRTDRSLEVKYKQVQPLCLPCTASSLTTS